MSDAKDFQPVEQVASWGSLPIGTSRIAVRHLVMVLGLALWLLPVLFMTGVHSIVWLSFNLAFLAILLLLTLPVRTVSLHKLAICFFAGGLFMGLNLALAAPLVKALPDSPLRLFLTVPMEEIAKLLPLAILLYLGRRFSSHTLSATDILLMGAASAAGFAIVEDAFSHSLSKSMNNLTVLLPTAEMVGGRLIAGHAIWSSLSAGSLGLAWLWKDRFRFAWLIALLGLSTAAIDHLALNWAPLQNTMFFGKSLVETLAASGYPTFVLFALVLGATLVSDLFVMFKSLPDAREFKINLKNRKDRKETLAGFWDSLLDLRRLAFAYFRYDQYERGAAPPSLALTVAILAKRLVNRYLAVEPVNITVSGSIDKAGVRITMPDLEKSIIVAPDKLGELTANRVGTGSGLGQFEGISPFDSRPLKDLIDLPERYEILEQVGEGGMGIIFRARHKLTGAPLAIKVLHPHLAKNKSYMQRFEQEARAASTLKHPSIVTVYDFGMTERKVAYLVMEWLEGPGLEKVLKSEKTLGTERVKNIFAQVADALSHAHRKGIVHRDIKPSNIIVSLDDKGQEQAKLVDFGIAKIVGEDTEEMRLTATGDVVGSPLYMSPEQCLGKDLDARSDIYSLGCVMYEALCGQAPFKAENSVQVIFKHLNEMPQRPLKLKPDLERPETIEGVLFRCLQKAPEDRYGSMDDLVAELRKQ